MWKKLTIVLSTAAAVVFVMAGLSASGTGFLASLVVVLAVVVGVVWAMAKLLGVHLSLSSWD